MTLEETYRAGRRELMEAGIESPAFDAVCIFEKYFGLDRQGLILRGREEAGQEASRAFFGSIRERAAGRPLQYILGVWPFLEMEPVSYTHLDVYKRQGQDGGFCRADPAASGRTRRAAGEKADPRARADADTGVGPADL